MATVSSMLHQAFEYYHWTVSCCKLASCTCWSHLVMGVGICSTSLLYSLGMVNVQLFRARESPRQFIDSVNATRNRQLRAFAQTQKAYGSCLWRYPSHLCSSGCYGNTQLVPIWCCVPSGFLPCTWSRHAGDWAIPRQFRLPANPILKGRMWCCGHQQSNPTSAQCSPVPRTHCMCIQVRCHQHVQMSTSDTWSVTCLTAMKESSKPAASLCCEVMSACTCCRAQQHACYSVSPPWQAFVRSGWQ